MARTHKYAGASAQISTGLDPTEIAALCEAAAKSSETIQALIRLEESKPGRLVYSIRNRVLGGRVEFMTFEVTMQPAGEGKRVRTRILTYKQKRQWILVIPLPWQMIAWNNYKRFMYALSEQISLRDSRAQTNVVEIASAA
ncbi:MAG TPA: hypothetical protein VMW80_11450 [Candidatus Dormibacteraeota bacterium]|nr:hypothetical protein [Candidatus Dormibacteraeota bacterium]